jgi:Na+/H+ antiporter NhaD/arsenite permease-like protein
MTRVPLRFSLSLFIALFTNVVFASDAGAPVPLIEVLGIPLEFILFAMVLLGVALFHNQTFTVAVSGLAVVVLYKLIFTGFKAGTGVAGLIGHLGHEWVTLANLFCLLLGFAILARHFEKSHVPTMLPRFLPHDWKGAFLLLVMIFFISSFLDNIAAALIGGAMAHQLFQGRVHIGYLAGIVAASNAGGAWSVVGDTTTTMMWIAGVSPGQVFECIVAALIAVVIFGIPAARLQQAYSPILKHTHAHTHINWSRIMVVILILVVAMITNITMNTQFPEISSSLPFIGLSVWGVIFLTIPVIRHDWEVIPENLKGTIFLLSLVTIASMMPVERLPAASWQTAMGLGFVSAVFDNIPLTALALKQGGYDWGFLAYAVGFGGSMIWFGSSAGVALSNMYPEAKSVGLWLRHGWFVAVAYVISFLSMVVMLGWHPAH